MGAEYGRHPRRFLILYTSTAPHFVANWVAAALPYAMVFTQAAQKLYKEKHYDDETKLLPRENLSVGQRGKGG